MVLSMLRCSVVGKWTGGAVGAETGKLRLNPEVSGASVFSLPVCCPLRRSGAAVSTPSGCVVSKALRLNVQPGPIHAQPFFSLGVIRHHFIHFVPERVRVVEVVHVAKRNRCLRPTIFLA